MCLAVTGKVVEVNGDAGSVVIGNRVRSVSLIAVPDVAMGDYVLVSLGMALEKITEAEAKEIDSTWEEISEIDLS